MDTDITGHQLEAVFLTQVEKGPKEVSHFTPLRQGFRCSHVFF